MSAPDMTKLRSALALVGHRQVHSDCGGATIYCVILADGFIVECGSGGYAERRAELLAEVINAAAPENFNFRGAKA